MSVGQVEGDEESESRSDSLRFADVLGEDEEVRFSWSATEVRWANEWRSAPDETTFAATDRRVIFATESGTTSIGYDHVRAVMTDAATDGFDVSTAFVASGGLSLVVGLLVATSDLLNGVGLVAISVALLIAGNTYGGSDGKATVTIVIDNERQRLSFAAEESVGSELSALVDGF